MEDFDVAAQACDAFRLPRVEGRAVAEEIVEATGLRGLDVGARDGPGERELSGGPARGELLQVDGRQALLQEDGELGVRVLGAELLDLAVAGEGDLRRSLDPGNGAGVTIPAL